MEVKKGPSPRFRALANLKKIPPDLPKDFMENYRTYNSGIEDYERSFEGVLEGKKFAEILEERTDPITVIDLLGQTDAIATLFEQIPDKEKRGLGVGLSDMRVIGKDIDRLARDRDMNISYIGSTSFSTTDTPTTDTSNGKLGDITTNTTWNAIDDWLGNNKADLILERGEGGLITLAHTKGFYGIMLQRIWDRLKPDGGMFVGQSLSRRSYQTFGIDPQEWAQRAKDSGIDIVYDERKMSWADGNMENTAGAIMLTKHPDSPPNLPF